jgi:hypothetical protein
MYVGLRVTAGCRRTFVPQASAIAVAATTDTTRVFLWGMVFSWSIMAGSKGVVSRSCGNHIIWGRLEIRRVAQWQQVGRTDNGNARRICTKYACLGRRGSRCTAHGEQHGQRGRAAVGDCALRHNGLKSHVLSGYAGAPWGSGDGIAKPE